MAENKFFFGLNEVHVAFLTDEAAGTYDTPEPIPGAVKLTLAPEGKPWDFFADDMKYANGDANNGYTGELEAALLPAAVKAEMLGWEVDSNGVLVEIADGVQKPFALLYSVKGDATGKRYVYYKCTAARPSNEHNTKGDTITPDTAKLPLTIVPIELDGEMSVGGSVEDTAETAAIFDAWYDAVTKPEWAVVS